MPLLTSLELRGGSRARISMGTPDQNVTLTIADGSVVAGSLVCRTLDFQASAGQAALAGRAQSVRLVASRRFEGDLSSLEAAQVSVELSGVSSVVVNATERLSVVASGASGVRYLDNPTIVRQELSGDSWLRKEARP